MKGHDRYEGIDKSDRPKQPDQAVRRCLSFFQVNRCHDDFICRIGGHGNGRDQCHIDRFLLTDHDGEGDDQADVQDQKQGGDRKKGFIPCGFLFIIPIDPLSCGDDRSPQDGKQDIVDTDRAVPQRGMMYAEISVIECEDQGHCKCPSCIDICLKVVFRSPSAEKAFDRAHCPSCLAAMRLFSGAVPRLRFTRPITA